MPYARYTHYDVTSGFDAHVLINGHDYAVPYVVPPPPYDVGRNTTGYWAFGTGGTKYGYAVLSTWLFTPLAHFFAGGNADNFVEANGSISGSVNNSGDLDAEGSLLRFATTSFKLTPPPALPEPASWALMVSGFGMVGAALRRQRPRHANSITSL
jgi:hypothetical protein